MLVNESITSFLNQIDDKTPTPGGGSVAALSSALGVSLTRMFQHLSLNKKSYLELDESIRIEFENVFNELSVIKEDLKQLIDLDTNAYNEVMSAYKLPKSNDEEIEIRNQRIEEATIKAIQVPFTVIKLSKEVMVKLPKIVKYGNKNAISDLGVATLLLATGMEGAILNVLINLSSLDDDELRQNYREQCALIQNEVNVIKMEIMSYVYNQIK